MAKLILSFSIAILLMVFAPVSLWADDPIPTPVEISPAMSDQIKAVRTENDISPEIMEEATKAAQSFQAPASPEDFKEIVEKAKTFTAPKQTADIIKRMYPDIDEKTLKSATVPSCHEAEANSNTLYYFFSFSMPLESIRDITAETLKLNKQCDTKIIMVLRGFIKNDFKQTFKVFYSMMKDMKEIANLPIEINPELFDKYNVTVVPTVVKRSSDSIGILRGETSLDFAVSKFKEQLIDHGTYGPIYPIAEEDILNVIASKQPMIENKLHDKIPQIRSSMFAIKKYDGQFSKAQEDRVYYVDPSVILSKDIFDNKGNVIIKHGTRFSPSSYVTLRKHIVIDGNDPKQVEFALKGNFHKILLISGDAEELMKKYKQRFYFLTDPIMGLLKIQKVPAIFEQEGDLIVVVEKHI